MTEDLTHLDEHGRARMVDVGGKAVTEREAQAQATVLMEPSTLQRLMAQQLPKGDSIATARIAGIMAAKRTSDLIPLCHPLALTAVEVDIAPHPNGAGVRIISTVRCRGQTGVEMEALTAASVAALTIYDMAKAVDPAMCITDVMLVRKRGGKSDFDHPQATESTLDQL